MKLTSDSQIRANRANSQHSTGPTSDEGKRQVAMNAIKHSFAGQTVVVPAHEADAYNQHFETFRKEYRPSGPTEAFLVQSLAEISYSVQQIRAQTTNATSLAGNRGIRTLNATSTPEIQCALGQADLAQELAPKLNLYGIYENRKMRLFNTTLQRLMELQTIRRAQEQADLEEAARYRKLCKANRDPNQPAWHPSENGFVCSLELIDRYIALEERLARLATPRTKAA